MSVTPFSAQALISFSRMAREAFASGIRQFQVKLGADCDNEADIARLRLVREAVGPGPIVYGDWNCGANRLDAIRVGSIAQRCAQIVREPGGVAQAVVEHARTVGHGIVGRRGEVVLAARDRGLYNAVTDCGAGGFSTSPFMSKLEAWQGQKKWPSSACQVTEQPKWVQRW